MTTDTDPPKSPGIIGFRALSGSCRTARACMGRFGPSQATSAQAQRPPGPSSSGGPDSSSAFEWRAPAPAHRWEERAARSCPCVTISAKPPTDVAITGRPNAYAVAITPDCVAVVYGTTTRRARCMSSATSSSGTYPLRTSTSWRDAPEQLGRQSPAPGKQQPPAGNILPNTTEGSQQRFQTLICAQSVRSRG